MSHPLASADTPVAAGRTALDAAGQDALYERIAARFAPALARLAGAYEADREQQRDLLQEIHLAVWRSLASFDGRCSIRTWVYRIAHNIAASHVLRSKRHRASSLRSLDEIEALPCATDSERLVDEASALERLSALIRELRPLDRDVMLLYLEGIEASEIGAIVGISSDNVATKVYRLKKLLERRFHLGEPHAP